MDDPTRRRVLSAMAGASATWLVGCTIGRGFGDSGEPSPQGAPPPPGAPPPATTCLDAVSGGTLLGVLPFELEGQLPLDTLVGEGLDGRLYTDLARLAYGAEVVDNARFYVRTRDPDRIDRARPWVVRVRGHVEREVDLGLAAIEALATPQGTCLLECSGNTEGGRFGLMSAAAWGGAPLVPLLRANTRPTSRATRVLVSGFDDHSQASTHSTPGASWVFSFAELEAAGAFLATTMNGAPLPPDHGAPVRLVVPGWYGCTNIKWVDEIRLVDDDEPSTIHMREFASRTHQPGTPARARDFAAAIIDQAAMPARVEKWRLPAGIRYRVVGIMWGGARPTDRLRMRVGVAEPEAVHVCPAPVTNRTWTWWSHVVRAPALGLHRITMTIDDPSVRTRRLDTQHYARAVRFDEA